MAVYRTESICIFRTPFRETSQVVHLLTPRMGRLAVLVKGAFRGKNRYQGNEDLLVLSKVVLSRRGSRGLDLLREREVLDVFPGLRQDLRRFSASSLILETLRASIPAGHHVQGIYPLFKDTLYALQNDVADTDIILFTYLGAFLKIIGFEPVLSRCTCCGRVPGDKAKLYVNPRKGGVVCRVCRSDKNDGLTLSSRAATLLERIPALDPGCSDEAHLPLQSRQEIWSFFEAFVPYFLEKKINSLAFARQCTGGAA